MSGVPSQIWICAAGKEAPDWIVERMTTADVAADGSFEIEATDGKVTVERGFAVFEFNEQVFACPPRMVQEKLVAAAGAEAPAVAELSGKLANMRDQKAASHRKPRTAEAERPLKLKPVIGSPPAPQFVAIADLNVDESYQRSIEGGASRKLIVKIAENWDWRLCLPLLVSRRSGVLYVIDGQHRKEAADIRGDIAHLPVVIFEFDDPKSEADLFITANRSRRNMSKLDDFHAAIVAGDKKAVAVHEVVTAVGLTIARNLAWQYWKPGEVVFVGAVQRLLQSQGRPVVETALGMMAEAFEGCTLVGGGAIFEGLVTYIQQRTRDSLPVEQGLMVSVLRGVGIPGWKEVTSEVDSGVDRADAMLKALADAYAEAEAE